MSLPKDDTGETPAQLKQRAEDLRTCARNARRIAGGLGPYLDKAAGEATPDIWTGPYAEATTAMLGARKTSLHTMASDLTADAARWEAHARSLDDQAADKQKKPGGH